MWVTTAKTVCQRCVGSKVAEAEAWGMASVVKWEQIASEQPASGSCCGVSCVIPAGRCQQGREALLVSLLGSELCQGFFRCPTVTVPLGLAAVHARNTSCATCQHSAAPHRLTCIILPLCRAFAPSSSHPHATASGRTAAELSAGICHHSAGFVLVWRDPS